MKACGIDLGTTNSCLFLVSNGEPKLIRDKQGRATVPSVVYQPRGGNVIVGYAAKNRMGDLPGPVTAIKRKIGIERNGCPRQRAEVPGRDLGHDPSVLAGNCRGS